jgi:catechol 2,3-dioxygenase-like lactoylglutathione lyase family enzyme
VELTAPDYMILIVEDLDRALHFYTGVLGLRLGHRSGDYAQLDTGATRLALYTRSAMANYRAQPGRLLMDTTINIILLVIGVAAIVAALWLHREFKRHEPP